MKYISEVYLRGWQSHVESVFKLGPGLNVITGPTDSGKTALLRSIRWVAFGEPAGESFVNAEVGEAEVVVRLSDGSAVRKHRRKGKTVHNVVLPGQEEPGTTFDKAEIPAEVTAALGLVVQKFGVLDMPLNFAYQLDEPFLISKPPSNGAIILGKLAGTEVVDLGIKQVAKETYAQNEERLAAKKAIQQKEKDLLEYTDLDGQKAQLVAALYLVGEIDKNTARRASMTVLLGAYGKASTNREEAQATVNRLANVPKLAADVVEIEKTLQRLTTLQGQNDQYSRLIPQLSDAEERLQLLANLPTWAAEVTRLDELATRSFRLGALAGTYQVAVETKALHEKRVEIMAPVVDLAPTVAWLEQAAGQRAKLDQLSGDYRRVLQEKARLESLAAHLTPVTEAAALVPGIEDNLARMRRLCDLQKSYLDKRVLQGGYEQAVAMEGNALRYYQKELADVWKEVGICPLCEQPYKGVTT